MEKKRDETTRLLQETRHGDQESGAELLSRLYIELKEIAGRYLYGERRDHTLSPTALVHEAYLRLVDRERVDWRGETQFKAYSAVSMRRILIDYARARRAEKRGGSTPHLSLHTLSDEPGPIRNDLILLDECLRQLSELNQRHARVVEMRFFGGMTYDEIASVLGLSDRTVKSDWAAARAFLFSEMLERKR